MIYENHEGFVSRDPRVEGAWPACEEKWGATHDLTTKVCRAQANICIAVDMSGSVCSPDFNSPKMCSNCASECLDEGYDKNTCCENFRVMQEFTANVLNELTHSGNLGTPDKQFSIVTYSSTAETATTLTDADTALSVVNNLVYTGGLTNHEQAIVKCQETLPTGPEDPPAFILMLTDGVPTSYGTSGSYSWWPNPPRTKALAAAEVAKAAGIRVETLHINPGSANNESTEYMKALSSHDAFHDIADFTGLTDIVTQFSAEIGCNAVIRPEDIPHEDEVRIPSCYVWVFCCIV